MPDKAYKNALELYNTVIKELSEEIPTQLEKQNIPGLAMAIISKKETIWSDGVGYTDNSKKQKTNIDTLFSLQSTTKTITAVAFLLAVQKGLVKLDDFVKNYYPEFTVNSRFGDDQVHKITFRHLLSHSAGLCRETRLGGCFDSTTCTWEEHIQSISGSWLKFSVGEGFSYSNAGMDLIPYILERITSQPYPEYVQEVLGDPLGITFYYDRHEVYAQPNAARGHLGDFKAAFTDNLGLGCGVAYLSIKDLATFVRFLLNLGTMNGKEILESDYVNALRSVEMEQGYGLGTFVIREFGTSIPHHPGGGFGLCCAMFWLPDHDIGIASFVNEEYAGFGYQMQIVKNTLKRILEAKGVSSKATEFPHFDKPKIEVEIHLLERLVGVYSGAEGTQSISMKDGVLFLGEEVLVPHSETIFSSKTSQGVIFQLDDQKKPFSLKLYTKNQGVLDMKYIGRPTDQSGPNREDWKQYEGIYQFHFYATEAYYETIKLEDGSLQRYSDGSFTRLYEHESIPNLFFTFTGQAVIFEKDYLYYDNMKADKIDDPVAYMTQLSDNNPKHRHLQDWCLDQVASQLKLLGRTEEENKILQLKQKLF